MVHYLDHNYQAHNVWNYSKMVVSLMTQIQKY